MNKFNVESLTSTQQDDELDLVGDLPAQNDEATSDEATSDEATSDDAQSEKGKGKKGKGKKATPPTTPPSENLPTATKSDEGKKQVPTENNTTQDKPVTPKLTAEGWAVH